MTGAKREAGACTLRSVEAAGVRTLVQHLADDCAGRAGPDRVTGLVP